MYINPWFSNRGWDLICEDGGSNNTTNNSNNHNNNNHDDKYLSHWQEDDADLIISGMGIA